MLKLAGLCRRVWRRWRNLDRLEAAEAQLGVARIMLAVTMRERDEMAGCADRAQSALSREWERRREERVNMRFWITRSASGTPACWN